jgi:membrane protein YqaA with SNARE-associated domain
LANTFLPLPTAWIVFLLAAPEYTLVQQTGWLRVLFVGGVLGTATVVANLNEYHLLAFLLRFGLGRRIRRARVYGWAVGWFDRAPFQILTLVAFVPIPVDALRWLAVLRGYSRSRFGLAYFVGRGMRYVLFAACSMFLELTVRQILLLQVALIVGALAGRLIWTVVQRRWLAARAGAAAAQTTLDAVARHYNDRGSGMARRG